MPAGHGNSLTKATAIRYASAPHAATGALVEVVRWATGSSNRQRRSAIAASCYGNVSTRIEWEHAFVSQRPRRVPYPVFRAALDQGDLQRVRLLAPEVGTIGLADAARICRLLGGGDPDAYDRAAVQWMRRFVVDARHVRLDDLVSAAGALDTLPNDAHRAMQVLSELCARHRLGH